jgi:hypothetical protein
MKKPLFDVKLKIWDSWKCYWSSVPWIVKKMSGYDSIGKERVVAGAFDPGTRTVHIFMDELAQATIARLEEYGQFNAVNYKEHLARSILATMTHELMHSLDIFHNEADNENHLIDTIKFFHLMQKSSWYNGILELRVNDDEYDHPTDSNTER